MHWKSVLKPLEEIKREKDTMKKSVKKDLSTKQIKKKRPYASPELVEYGALVDLTQGATGSRGDGMGTMKV